MQTIKTTNRRKNYFIKKEFQLNFIYRFIALIVLEAILIAALLIYVSKGTLTTAYYGTYLEIEKTPVFFFKNFIIITIITGVAIGLGGLFIFIYLSHRLAGPLYRFEKTIKGISEGDVSFRVNLREKDQLKGLQVHLNNLLINIDERIKKIKKCIDEGSTVSGDSGLKKIFNDLKENINFFKTSK